MARWQYLMIIHEFHMDRRGENRANKNDIALPPGKLTRVCKCSPRHTHPYKIHKRWDEGFCFASSQLLLAGCSMKSQFVSPILHIGCGWEVEFLMLSSHRWVAMGRAFPEDSQQLAWVLNFKFIISTYRRTTTTWLFCWYSLSL